jgi:hypothetical protein
VPPLGPSSAVEYTVEQEPVFDIEDKGLVFDIEPVSDNLGVDNLTTTSRIGNLHPSANMVDLEAACIHRTYMCMKVEEVHKRPLFNTIVVCHPKPATSDKPTTTMRSKRNAHYNNTPLYQQSVTLYSNEQTTHCCCPIATMAVTEPPQK